MEDYPNFVDCTMFGTRGEKLQPYLTKGTKVAIEGKLRYSSWERDGQRRSKLEVIVDELEFMSSRNGNNANQGYDNSMTQVMPAARSDGRSRCSSDRRCLCFGLRRRHPVLIMDATN